MRLRRSVVESSQCAGFEVAGRLKEGEKGRRRTWAVDVACKAFTGMVGGYCGR